MEISEINQSVLIRDADSEGAGGVNGQNHGLEGLHRRHGFLRASQIKWFSRNALINGRTEV